MIFEFLEKSFAPEGEYILNSWQVKKYLRSTKLSGNRAACSRLTLLKKSEKYRQIIKGQITK